MAREFNRSQRVSQALRQEIAIILQREIKDPRIDLASVSHVDLSRDLAYAKVYVTFLLMKEPDAIKAAMKALNEAAGYIRNLVGKSMSLRIIPELTFFYDDTLEKGIAMSSLVDQVIKKDRERRENSGNDD